MRLLAVTFVILIKCGFLFGQDGSDMNYVKADELDQSYVGRKVHLDFNQRSFSFKRDSSRPLDTIIIEVNGKKVKFIEHRIDDGYNNWFKDQFLESVDEIKDLKLRVTEFELLKVNEKDILVRGYFVFFDKKGQALPEKSFSKDILFEKKEIVEFLFKAKDK